MAITFTCLQSCGTMFCSRNLLNKFNKRLLALPGRFFNKLNLILSNPGALLLQDRRATENSAIVKGDSIASWPGDASRTIFCSGTESGHTFLAKSNIHLLEDSSLSLTVTRFRILRAVFQRVLIDVSLDVSFTNRRQYPRFFALARLLSLVLSSEYRI